MLLRITEKCRMECPHCLVCATPDGKHMSRDLFVKSLEFLDRLGAKCLVISGGEPTDHPMFFEFMDIVKHGLREVFVIITSNGMFLDDDSFVEKMYEITGDGIEDFENPMEVLSAAMDCIGSGYDGNVVVPLLEFAISLLKEKL